MNNERLMRNISLQPADLAELEKAIQMTEQSSSGEIVIAIAEESSDYSFRELFAAVLFGAAVFTLLLLCNSYVTQWMKYHWWHVEPSLVTAVTGAVSFLAMAVFFIFANVPAIDSLIVPKKEKEQAVYRRALRHFVESGVYATKERTGILIYISCMERQVRILADTGIRTKIDESYWKDRALEVAHGIKTGTTKKALLSTIQAMSTILSQHFPPSPQNPDELENAITFIRRGQ
ncbi:MAG TPA: hypothetical protein PKH81_06080 [Treponemataceae bacterium]|nr:hypothetical protein [Treponemataceae bacterium]